MISSFLAILMLAAQGEPKAAPSLRCGGHCLYIALDGLGLAPPAYERLEKGLGAPGGKGYSLHQLEQEARSYGTKTTAVETTVENLRARTEPFTCITGVNGDHFVLLYDIDDEYAYLIDYPTKRRVPLSTFEAGWDHKALLISTVPLASEESIASALSWRRRGRMFLFVLVGCFGLGIALLFLRRNRRRSLAHQLSIMLALAGTSVFIAGCDKAPKRVSGSAAIPARLVALPLRHQLGLIRIESPQQVAHVETKLKNPGSTPLKITGIVKSCDCTDTKLSANPIPAHGEATLSAAIRLGNSAEPRASRLGIVTERDRDSGLEIVIEWQVSPPLRTQPTLLNLPQLLPGAGASKSVSVHLDGLSLCPACKLVAQSDDRFLITQMKTNSGLPVSGHAAPSAKAPGYDAGQLDLKIRPQDEFRQFHEIVMLRLVCGEETRASFSLPVTWQVVPPVIATPERLMLGQVTGGDTVTRHIIMRTRDGTAFRILDVSCNESGILKSSQFAEKDNVVQTIDLKVTPPKVVGPWRTLVEIRTSAADAPKILFPISGLVGASPAEGKPTGKSAERAEAPDVH
jgi:hypothetical protein